MRSRQLHSPLCLLSLGIMLAFSTDARSAVLEVDDDLAQCPLAGFASVAAAVTAASATDTVRVCDGTYIEPQITIDKNLTVTSLNGPAVTKIEGTGVYTFFITDAASVFPTSVTIEELDISNPTNGALDTDSAGIQVGGDPNNGASGITIRNNLIHLPRDPNVPDCGFVGALGISMNFVKDVTTKGNEIFDIDNDGCSSGFTSKARGIFIKGRDGGGTITITGNDIHDVSGERAGGISLITTTQLVGTDSIVISGNMIASITDSVGQRGSYGMEFDGVDGSAGSGASLTGNTVDGTAIAFRFSSSKNFTSTGNTFTNLIPGGFGAADPFNVLLNTGSMSIEHCGNSDDPNGIFFADVFGTTGNKFPGGSAFPGNKNCLPSDNIPLAPRPGLALFCCGLLAIGAWLLARRANTLAAMPR